MNDAILQARVRAVEEALEALADKRGSGPEVASIMAEVRLLLRELVRANRFLDAIIENLPAMVFVKDANRLAFERFNRAGEVLLGVSRDALLGKTDRDLFAPEMADFFQAEDRRTLEGGILVDIPEEPIDTANGRRLLHTRKVPIFDDDGTPAHLLGISLDITERKAAEAEALREKQRAEVANRELEAFCYSVAHDLRTPLRGIEGFSLALLEDYGATLDETASDYLRRVRQSAQQMAMLIDDLLSLSRVSRAQVERRTVDLSEVARATVARLRSASPERNVEAVIEEGLTAECDPVLITILLENLLGNAWKFTQRRAAARIELGATRGEGATVFFVRDDGAGFDMAYSKKLFGVFQRLHSASEFEGTGIGLATVQRVVERHGGRVWAHGRVEAGATFFFTLEP